MFWKEFAFPLDVHVLSTQKRKRSWWRFLTLPPQNLSPQPNQPRCWDTYRGCWCDDVRTGFSLLKWANNCLPIVAGGCSSVNQDDVPSSRFQLDVWIACNLFDWVLPIQNNRDGLYIYQRTDFNNIAGSAWLLIEQTLGDAPICDIGQPW